MCHASWRMSSPAKAKVRVNAAKKREEAAAGSETDDEFPFRPR